MIEHLLDVDSLILVPGDSEWGWFVKTACILCFTCTELFCGGRGYVNCVVLARCYGTRGIPIVINNKSAYRPTIF